MDTSPIIPREVLDGMNTVGTEAVDSLKGYFTTPSPAEVTTKKCDQALTFLGRYSGLVSSQTKLLALQLQVTKAMGIRGDALRPLLAEIAPGSYRMPAVPPTIEAKIAEEAK